MRRADAWILAPGLALAAGAALVAAEGPSTHRLTDSALAAVGVLLLWSVAAAVHVRYPGRPLGLLLFAVALGSALQPFVASPNALLFTLARAARPAVEVLLVWVMLAFPTGRLAGWQERALVACAAGAVLLLWLPGMMFSPRVPLPGPFVTCGFDCPENLLFVADRPDWSSVLLWSFRITGAAILAATSLWLFLRLRRATPLMRRSLAPVLLASMARALNVAAFLATGGTLVLLTFTFWLVPLSIGLGLLRGRLYAARALQRLVSGRRRHPRLGELRDVMADALDDPQLAIGYWDERESQWVDSTGRRIELRAAGAGRAVRIVQDDQGRAVAALLHDPALLEEPLLLDAVAGTMLLALVSDQAEAALADARTQSTRAIETERRRFERDLHDGAQQRLLALRMKLGVAERLLDADRTRAAALLGEMGWDIDAALLELRALAHGMVPSLLVERGLQAALADAAAHAPIAVELDVPDVGRCDPGVERAVYFCCTEALQNAIKHAGPSATARLTLRRNDDQLRFNVEDDGGGRGVQPTQAEGHGIHNMRERMLSVGGHLDVAPNPAGGYAVAGTVPRAARSGG